MTSKYDALAEHLRKLPGPAVEMTFADVEKVVGELPMAARTYRAWWSNNNSFTHARNGWLAAGWKTAKVSMENRRLTFVRTSGPGSELVHVAPDLVASALRIVPRQAQSQEAWQEIEELAGGRDNVLEIIRALQRYVDGEIVETELGRIIRKYWGKGGKAP